MPTDRHNKICTLDELYKNGVNSMDQDKGPLRCNSKFSDVQRTEAGMDLDTLLVREIGQFGRYQWRLAIASTFVAMVTALSSAEYIFTTARINTRCLVPECEVANVTEFSPPWLVNAIPSADGSIDGCHRFATNPNFTEVIDVSCPAVQFDSTVTVPCEQYVFEDTRTVVYDLGLACEDWRRSLIGSARTFGIMLGMSITGVVSDRWGRRTALVITAVNTAWLGALRYWANSYLTFVIGQFAETVLGSGTYSCTFILLLELVGPKYRVRAGAATSTGNALGNMSVALIAWAVPYWRNLTLAIYVPQLLCIFYFLILPESIRWYQSKGKFDKAEKAIMKVARVNGKVISEKALIEFKNAEAKAQKNEIENEKKEEPWLIIQVFQHRPILVRCLTSPLWWITTKFVYYGLSINAVNIVGNRFLNYALVAMVEIPGAWAGAVLLDRVGRKPVLAGGFWLCALCQLGYIFTSNNSFGLSLMIYLMGKCCISTVISTVLIYTTELYPTRYRHSLFAFSSMMGHIGAILAPLTPALGSAVFPSLPFVLFGGMALGAGLLVLACPETLRLPDTMQQAAQIGQDKSRLN